MQRSIEALSEQYKLTVMVSMAGALELYSFLIFAMMAHYIALHFFPSGALFQALLGTYAIFALGYIARPLGGLLLQRMGDRFGRRKAGMVSTSALAISTVLMGILPGYDAVGVLSIVCLALLRIVQGAAMGSDIVGVMAYLDERACDRSGFVTALLFLALMVGIDAGALIHGLLTLYLSEAEMIEWGWRIPFLLCGVLGFISYGIRRWFCDSGLLSKLDATRRKSSLPVTLLWTRHRAQVLYGVLVVALYSSTVTMFGAYMPGYLPLLLGLPENEVAWHMGLAFLVLLPVPVMAGLLGDRLGRHWLMVAFALSLVCLSWPIFHYFAADDAKIRKILMVCALYTGLATGLLPSLLAHCFPPEARFSGIALVYSVGFAVFGGMSPLISTVLTHVMGVSQGPAVFMAGIALLSLLVLILPKPQPWCADKAPDTRSCSA